MKKLLLLLCFLSTSGTGQAYASALAQSSPSYFDRAPELLGAETTFTETGFMRPTYFYYIKVPTGIGKGIQRIEIRQEEGGEPIDYNPTAITVMGTTNIPVQAQLQDRLLVLNFPTPVAGGQTLTIAISPYQNPLLSGIYQFKVTAFPPGASARGQYLGYARFHFDRPLD
jgi:hypothetical protein